MTMPEVFNLRDDISRNMRHERKEEEDSPASKIA